MNALVAGLTDMPHIVSLHGGCTADEGEESAESFLHVQLTK